MYVNRTYDYDICILKLNETLTFGPKVNKIALNDNNVKLRKGLMFNTTGWGYTEVSMQISFLNMINTKILIIKLIKYC